MKKFSKRALLANTFGTLGYAFSIFAWAWVGVLYLPGIMANETVNNFLFPASNQENTYIPPSFESSPIVTFGALAITAIIMLITVVMLIRIPITIAKTGKKLTTKAADAAVPLATRKHPASVAEKRRLTARFIMVTKLLVVIVPVCLQLGGFVFKLPIPYEIAVFISCILAILGLICFSLQYGLAHLLGVNANKLV